MKYNKKILTVCFLFSAFILIPYLCIAVDYPDARTIIKQLEKNLNGKTAFMAIEMSVTTSRGKRTMKMDSYSVGNKKSFIKITYPGKDKGITFLKIDNSMWQYVPRIEKTIKIPASMMLQSWMGSDFTNDDLVKESSLSEDYKATIIQNKEDSDNWNILLIPAEDAPVVWGKIQMVISKTRLLPKKVSYFDEEGQLVRTLYYEQIVQFGNRHYPSRWVMIPEDPDKSGHKTVILVHEARFDQPIDDNYFTKRALKRFSR